MLEITEMLQQAGLEGLGELGIKVVEYENYYVLDYSQIDSPKEHPLVMECRGTIVRKDTFEVVCLPFRRFSNLFETESTYTIPIEDCIAVEKSDGSLIKVWWDPIEGVWQVATRGTAYAEGDVQGWGITFRELFYRTVGGEEEFQSLANLHLNRSYTHLFELCCSENRVVTPYDSDRVYYLSSRNNFTGECKELDIYYEMLFPLRIKQSNFSVFSSFEDILDSVKVMKGLEEGYVLYLGGEPVCKVKSPLYVKAHHVRGEGLTPKRIVDLIWEGEMEEYLTYFPNDSDKVSPYRIAYKNMLESCLCVKDLSSTIEDQKRFAMTVKHLPISGIVFSIRKGMSIAEALERVTKNRRLEILEQYLDLEE